MRTPTVEAMLGGKLTTLGPGTIGIPRGKPNFDVAMGKQLFDLTHFLPLVRDLGAVAQSYRAAYDQQCSYHPPEARSSLEAALDDAMYALKLLAAPKNAKGPNPEWSRDLAQLSSVALKLRGYVGEEARFDRVTVRSAASQLSLFLALIRKVLLDGLPADEARLRWEGQCGCIAAERLNPEAIAAAQSRLRSLPWAERPHINLREFVQAVGPEALLYWDATYRELQHSQRLE